MNKAEAGKLGAIKTNIIQAKQKAKRIEQYNNNPKICLYCNNPLSYEKRKYKFCNRSCSASYNNSMSPKRIKKNKIIPCGVSVKEYIKVFCLNCNMEISVHNDKYCSIKCHHEYEWKLFKQKVENNELVTERRLKRYLLDKKHECSICNTKEWLSEPIMLILDHIDGDSKNTRLSNCRLVCSNCDATLTTYKNRNKNGTRFERRKRYQEGKTY